MGRGGQGSPRPIVRTGTVRVKDDVAHRVWLGHPFIYREALDPRHPVGALGSTVLVLDSAGEFVGKGIVDGSTAIAVRIFSRNPEQVVDSELWSRRVTEAIDLRRALFDLEQLTCLRLINGESDGLPAISVDRYGEYLVVQVGSPAMLEVAEVVYDALFTQLSPKGIYEQRRFKPLSGQAPKKGASLVRGDAAPVEFEVQENELKFLVDVTSPLSTGVFADLRLGREAVARWSKDKRVLNLFSYTGAISVYATHGGAAQVAAVDVHAKSHARARRNFAINGFDSEKPELIVGDALKTLARFADRGRQFDVVVIDPPAFASGAKGGKPWNSTKDYRELVASCIEVLPPGGVLIAACSTHKMSQADFDQALADGGSRAGRVVKIVERQWLPMDFPVCPGFPEGNYLKFAVSIVL